MPSNFFVNAILFLVNIFTFSTLSSFSSLHFATFYTYQHLQKKTPKLSSFNAKKSYIINKLQILSISPQRFTLNSHPNNPPYHTTFATHHLLYTLATWPNQDHEIPIPDPYNLSVISSVFLWFSPSDSSITPPEVFVIQWLQQLPYFEPPILANCRLKLVIFTLI